MRIYEAQSSFTPSPRTLIVTPAWLRLLDFDASEAILNRPHTFELISRNASARIPLHEPDLVIERARFMRLLSHKAQEAGAELVLGRRFQGLESRNPSLTLRLRGAKDGKRVVASTVLGADGVQSTVAQAAGTDGLERVAILQARVPLPSDLAPHTVRVWFDRQSTRFFHWLIPESDRTAAAGVIADRPAQARSALTRLMSAHDLDPLEYQAAWVPLHPWRFSSIAASGDKRVLLMGDAAGQVKITTVGGVVTGMRGAAAAARSILKGTAYASELRGLRLELNFHTAVRHVLDHLTDEDYDELLTLLNQRGTSVLSQHSRDELTRFLWRLLPAQPRWLVLGAKALARSLWEGVPG